MTLPLLFFSELVFKQRFSAQDNYFAEANEL